MNNNDLLLDGADWKNFLDSQGWELPPLPHIAMIVNGVERASAPIEEFRLIIRPGIRIFDPR